MPEGTFISKWLLFTIIAGLAHRMFTFERVEFWMSFLKAWVERWLHGDIFMLEVWEQRHFLAGNLWHIYICFKPSLGTDSLPTHSEINIAIVSTARSQVSLHHVAALKVNIHKKRSGYLFCVMFLQSQILSISFGFYWDLLLNHGSSGRAANIFSLAKPVIFFLILSIFHFPALATPFSWSHF